MPPLEGPPLPPVSIRRDGEGIGRDKVSFARWLFAVRGLFTKRINPEVLQEPRVVVVAASLPDCFDQVPYLMF